MKLRSGSKIYYACMIVALLIGIAPAALIYLVDPYAIFAEQSRPVKISEIAEKAHYPLWRLARYQAGSHDTVILGDSRSRAWREKYWHELGADGALNLAYGGGTIPEIYETFQTIKHDRAIRSLVVGLQLRSFDEDHKAGMNRVPEAVRLLSAKTDYLQNWSVAKTASQMLIAENQEIAAQVARYIPRIVGEAAATELGRLGKVPLSTLLLPDVCFGCDLPRGLSSMPVGNNTPYYSDVLGIIGHTNDRPDGWSRAVNYAPFSGLYAQIQPARELPSKIARQVAKNGRSDWSGFEFSHNYWRMIKEMSDWAKQHNWQLTFVVPPTIVEMQATIYEAGLGEMNHQMRLELARFGTVLDFDFPSITTAKASNFSDAYHFNSKISRLLVQEIMLQTSQNEAVRKLATKRQQSIRCAATDDVPQIFDTEIVMQSGNSCRTWRRIRS